MSAEVLVTGGTGVLGLQIVERLRSGRARVRVMSHSGKPGAIHGDLLTGEGLERAMRGVDTIVHCATSPFRKPEQVDIGGTANMLRMAARAGVSHCVYISIVGIDGAASYPYYDIKLKTEHVVEESPVPHTILRATQFHDLILMAVRFLDRLPVMPLPFGFLGQPIDSGEVADRMAELALSEPAGRVPDIGGPEVASLEDAVRTYLKVKGSKKRIVRLPFPGKTARAFREGAIVCPDNRYGTITWEEFLRAEVNIRDAA